MIGRAPSGSPIPRGDHTVKIHVTVNGTAHDSEVEPRTLLVHYVREALGLTGTNVGCDTSSCGACSLHLNGEAVKSCTVLAVQADGAEILTIEGLAHDVMLEDDWRKAAEVLLEFFGAVGEMVRWGGTH